MMLGLRRAEGVSEEQLCARYGLAPREAFATEIERFCEEGLLVAEEGRLRIPRAKWLLSNEVLAHFVV
jgi:coproporphyrinogen III oxidase-like Fe-S oxidoreductase